MVLCAIIKLKNNFKNTLMKKFIIFGIGVMTSCLSAQEKSGLHIGVEIGNCANSSKYSSGASIANARFNQQIFYAPNMNIVARYDFNKHWMAMSGIGFNAIGFGFSLSEDYKLVNRPKNISDNKNAFAAIEIPVTLHYKSNLNCKNSRWLLGAGIVPTFVGKQSVDNTYSISNEDNSTSYLTSQSNTNNDLGLILRYSVSREKVFNNGSILQASLLVNVGLNTIASSTVNYQVDKQNYTHTFSNKGGSVGLRVAYFFKSF